MIRADKNEYFPISVVLLDDYTGELVSGQTVYYDIRDADTDDPLSPPIDGTVPESVVEAGIYTIVEKIPTAGEYIIYTTCSGFVSNTEEIIINEENIYELTKQIRHYNISVEDVQRTNVISTASQTARNVPLNQTDYIITKIKLDTDPDWSGTVASGIVYAHYRTDTDLVPYKMGDDGL